MAASYQSIRKPKLTRPEVADEIARRLGLTARDARTVLDTVIDVLRDKVSDGHPVELRGFAMLSRRWRRSRPAINPKTREGGFEVPARFVVTIKPSSVFLVEKRKARSNEQR